MAEVLRFIDTASSGGNGTTRDHSGVNAAYASMSAWEAAEQTDLVADGDTHRVKCSGSIADTTQVTIAGWTTDATHFITIEGDNDTPDNDGRFTGSAAYSLNHYRLEVSSTFHALGISVGFIEIFGIQVLSSASNANNGTIKISSAPSVVASCRIRLTGTSAGAIALGNQSLVSLSTIWTGHRFASTFAFVNNIIVIPTAGNGIDFSMSDFAWTPVIKIIGNTIHAANWGILWTPATPNVAGTFIITNNAIVESITAQAISDYAAQVSGSIVTQDFNAYESGEAIIGANSTNISPTKTNDFVAPGSGESADFTPVDTGLAIFEKGDFSTDVSPDINNIIRKAVPDIAAMELLLILNLLKITGPVKLAFDTITKQLHVAIVSAEGTTDMGRIMFT